MQRMYLRDGRLYTVTDSPPGKPQAGATSVAARAEKWISRLVGKTGSK
jgi:hypothetical protein